MFAFSTFSRGDGAGRRRRLPNQRISTHIVSRNPRSIKTNDFLCTPCAICLIPKVQGMRDDPIMACGGRSSIKSLILCSKTTPLPSQTLGNVTTRGWKAHKTAIFQTFRYIKLIIQSRMKFSQKISHMKIIFPELRRIEAPKKDFESKFESKFDFDSILDFEIEASIRCQP